VFVDLVDRSVEEIIEGQKMNSITSLLVDYLDPVVEHFDGSSRTGMMRWVLEFLENNVSDRGIQAIIDELENVQWSLIFERFLKRE